jgi:putative phosphoribosyl transferase
MFRNREDAGLQLAQRLKGRRLSSPLILAIPRGGVVVGAALAREVGAELDVVLARKLRAPEQPELAIGAISETGHVYLNTFAEDVLLAREDYLGRERRHQLAEISQFREMLRGSRPPAEVAGRSVIVTDDGITTGSTMIAALQVIRAQNPYELIAAVPVVAPEQLVEVRHWCDELVYLFSPEPFLAISHVYQDFTSVEDEQAVSLLRAASAHAERLG